MDTGTIKVYARLSKGYGGVSLLKMDHVFLQPDGGYNWNCFGGGIEELLCPEKKPEDVRPYCIGEIRGNVEWMRLAYGKDGEGVKDNSCPAAGVYNLYSGVCQNVANRILAMG